MKTYFGVLFDTSGSMYENFKSINNVKEVNKKSDALIPILKNLCNNSEKNIFTILFGLQEDPVIIDFNKLL